MKKYKIELQRTFTYVAEIEANDKQEVTDKEQEIIEKICEEDFNLLDHAQDNDWEIVDIEEMR